MQNNKLTIAAIVALMIVFVLLSLSYQKQIELFGGYHRVGAAISKTNPAGTYVAFLSSADTPGRTILLQLNDDNDHTMSMSADYHNSRPAIVDYGTWQITPVGFDVTFTTRDGLVLSKPQTLSFFVTVASIELINPDKVTWGSDGLVFHTSPLPLPSRWVWTGTVLKDGKSISPQPNKPFVLNFTPDNKIHIQGDCSEITDIFGLRDSNGIAISQFAALGAYCDGSQEGVFAQDLARSISYNVSSSALSLTLPNGSGMMTFSPYVDEVQ